MQSEDTWMELHVLHRHGWSIAALAREFGVNWRTARRYASAPEPRYRPSARPAELTAAQLAHVGRRLAACPELRVTVLLRELRERYGYRSSYASLPGGFACCGRPTRPSPSCASRPGPGSRSRATGPTAAVWPLGDAAAELHAFVAILGFTRMVALRFATDPTRPTTLGCCPRA